MAVSSNDASCIAISSAISIIFNAYMPIQLVPSACSSFVSPAKCELRLNTPILSKPRNPPSKILLPFTVFSVDPPGKIDQQFLKNLFQEMEYHHTCLFFFNTIYLHCGPCLYRRIYIAEIPFVSRQLSIGFHIPFPHDQQQLVLGKSRIHHRHRNTMKSKIPCGIPGIFPFIGHGNNILVFQMFPVIITPVFLSITNRRNTIDCIEPCVLHQNDNIVCSITVLPMPVAVSLPYPHSYLSARIAA